eukprot:gene10615-14256_t
MQGHSEFTIGGVLENWSITDRLKQINCPSMVLVGEYDSMTIECSQTIVDNIPGCWPLVIIPRAAHCKLVDEPQVCVQHVVNFVKSIESIHNNYNV